MWGDVDAVILYTLKNIKLKFKNQEEFRSGDSQTPDKAQSFLNDKSFSAC